MIRGARPSGHVQWPQSMQYCGDPRVPGTTVDDAEEQPDAEHREQTAPAHAGGSGEVVDVQRTEREDRVRSEQAGRSPEATSQFSLQPATVEKLLHGPPKESGENGEQP